MEEKRLIERVQKMLGYVPIGTLDLLHILAHPDCIEITRAFLDEKERQ